MLLGQEKGACRVTDEKEGCVAAAVSACVHCLCHIDFRMGKRAGVRLINDNLVKPDKLIFRVSGIFFLIIQITVSSFYRKIQRGPRSMFWQCKPSPPWC